MSYIARQILDRIAVGDNTFALNKVAEPNVYELVHMPTEVIIEGTVINRALLQPIEESMGDFKNRVETLPSSTSELENIEISAGSVANNTLGWFTVTLPKELSIVPSVTVSISQTGYTSIYIAQVQLVTKTSFQVCVRKLNVASGSYYTALSSSASSTHNAYTLVSGVSYDTTTDAVIVNWLAIADNSI